MTEVLIDPNVMLDMEMKYFEDAVQVSAAHHHGIRTVITRNLVDFMNSGMDVRTPEQFVSDMGRS